MLILSRRKGQGFMITKDVHIVILSNKNGDVELGISAPRSIPILRSELLHKGVRKMQERFN
jgi:carbon storage regulator